MLKYLDAFPVKRRQSLAQKYEVGRVAFLNTSYTLNLYIRTTNLVFVSKYRI